LRAFETPMNNLKISTAQLEHKSGDKAYNLSVIEKLMEKTSREGSHAIAFHECSITGYKSFAVILTLLLSCLELLGQSEAIKKVHKKIAHIDSYKKYDIIKIDEPADLKTINKSLLELTNYSRRKDDQGKVEEKLAIPGGQCHRIYYFDKYRNLVFIKEKINQNDHTTVQNYYFDNNTLLAVTDDKSTDLLSQIDKTELRNRVKGYWRIEIK
jgi:hypothetical protein